MARDILGLGGPDAHVKNLDSTPTDRDTDEQKRRRRMREGADEVGTGRPTAYRQSDGATGIDMGAGGDGTDIE